MTRKRRPMIATLLFVALTLIVVLVAACSSSSPAASPSASASASPKASAPAPSSAAPSPSASAKAPSAEEQAYQKAQADWQKVVEAARKEGEAVIYTIFDQTKSLPYMEGFNKLDPKIQVKLVQQGATVSQRFQAEASTKQYIGNAYMSGTASTRMIANMGLAQAVEDLPVIFEPGVKWHVPPLFDKPHEPVSFAFTKYHLIYNTNLVKPADEPKTWRDLADPKWKNKFALWDPRLAGYGRQVLTTLYMTPDYGPDLVRKIVDNMVVVPQTNDGALAVAKGEYAMTIGTWSAYLLVKDGPVKQISPTDGAMFSPTQVTVVKNAPQLNVTKVFLNWLLSKEGQAVVGLGNATIRPDANAAAKETQLMTGEKFFTNVPFTWDFEMNRVDSAAKIIDGWLNDAKK